jgi:hypothetical protein
MHCVTVKVAPSWPVAMHFINDVGRPWFHGGKHGENQNNHRQRGHLYGNCVYCCGRVHTDANPYSYIQSYPNSDANTDTDTNTESRPYAAASRESAESS